MKNKEVFSKVEVLRVREMLIIEPSIVPARPAMSASLPRRSWGPS